MRPIAARAAKLSLTLALMATAGLAVQKLANAANPNPANGEKLLAMIRWRVSGKDGHLLCKVSEREGLDGSAASSRTLQVEREAEGKPAAAFAFETPDAILNIYPLGDYNARLMTTWVGGSAYRVRVLAYIDGQVKQVFDEGTKMPPEVLYDDQGRESILITTPAMKNGRWTVAAGTTAIFKWNGHGYDEVGVTPWAKRFRLAGGPS